MCIPKSKCTDKVCPMCRINCPYGMRMGDDGCPKCECKESVCEVNKIFILILKYNVLSDLLSVCCEI